VLYLTLQTMSKSIQLIFHTVAVFSKAGRPNSENPEVALAGCILNNTRIHDAIKVRPLTDSVHD